jgi:hypothetical protein
MIIYFALVFFVFLVIGLPTFFSGCGTKIPNTCFAYYDIKGTVYGSKITNHMCSECIKKENKKCVQYNYYTCYNGYVKISYNLKGKNETCVYDAYKDEKSFTDTQNKLSYYYPKGLTDTLFVKKIEHEDCSMNDVGLQGLTYVGITFLSLAGLVAIIGVILDLKEKMQVAAKNNFSKVEAAEV